MIRNLSLSEEAEAVELGWSVRMGNIFMVYDAKTGLHKFEGRPTYPNLLKAIYKQAETRRWIFEFMLERPWSIDPNSELASKEGWVLESYYGEAADFGPAPAVMWGNAPKFQNKEEVLHHVMERAAQNSLLHIKALNLIAKNKLTNGG